MAVSMPHREVFVEENNIISEASHENTGQPDGVVAPGTNTSSNDYVETVLTRLLQYQRRSELPLGSK